MTTLAATFETLNKKRVALIHEAALTGKVDQAAIDKLQAELQAAHRAQDLENEIRSARQTIEAQQRRTSNAEHLAELVQAAELKAEIADKLGAEIDADIAALRAKIGTWQAACREVENASQQVRHFGGQTGQSFLPVGVPAYDILIVVTRMGDYHKRPLQTLDRCYKVYPTR